MRCLAKIATIILLLSCGQHITFSSAAFAEELNQSATDSGDTRDNSSSAALVTDLISAAKQSGMRVIVIDDTTPAKPAVAVEPNPYDTLMMPPPAASSVMKLQTNVLEFRETLKTKLAEIPDSITQTQNELRKNSPTGELHAFLRVLYWSLVLLAFGAWVEHEIYIKRIVERWLEPDLLDKPVGYLEKIPLLLKRASLKVIGVLISMAVAFFTGSQIFKGTPPESIQFTIAVIYLGYAACRLIGIIWRLILAPYLNQYRIPHFADKDARRLFHWLWVISSINILVLMFSIWIGELGGTSHIHAAMATFFGAVIALANIIMVIANRQALSLAIRNGKSTTAISTIQRLLSKTWLAFAIGYFVFSWLDMVYRAVLAKPMSTPLIAGAYGILISVICVYALINFFIERFFQREKRYVMLEPEHSGDDASDNPEHQTDATPAAADDEPTDMVIKRHPLATYEDLARRVAGILAVITGFWALTKIWNFDNSMMYDIISDRSTDAITILFIGYIIYHIVRIWIDNKIQEEGGDVSLAPGDEGGATGASRLATLLPLFRNFMLVVISLSVIFSALLEIGINVSPLFASAGVVGLAIGFGAQTLVRDIFSGAFYLFDDAFRRGEYVDIGGVKGTVEKISVRSFQLRHHLGPLHTIPFGEIQSLTNFSRDWVMMKLKLRLTYDTDPERVRKLIKKLGQSLMQDPVIGDTFLQPLKSQGVIEMQDSAMIVRVKFMCKPGDQWVIRKRVYQEIRDLFSREGIKFAHKEVTVRLAGDVPQNLTAQQTQTIAAAALDDEEDNNQSGPSDDR